MLRPSLLPMILVTELAEWSESEPGHMPGDMFISSLSLWCFCLTHVPASFNLALLLHNGLLRYSSLFCIPSTLYCKCFSPILYLFFSGIDSLALAFKLLRSYASTLLQDICNFSVGSSLFPSLPCAWSKSL